MNRGKCSYGYTYDEIAELMGARLNEFTKWMSGQTMMICDGREYSHETEKYSDTGCGPHGIVTYAWDVDRFLGKHGKAALELWD